MLPGHTLHKYGNLLSTVQKAIIHSSEQDLQYLQNFSSFLLASTFFNITKQGCNNTELGGCNTG
jgi:hypothetical protein